MATPKVSWIVPVYNQEEYIVESVNSIIDQTFEDFELIIVNDGSTDNTFDHISSIKDKRIMVLNNKNNAGVSKSLNTGIKASSGQYIARMDGDDICTPDRLEKQVEFMDMNPEMAVCGSHVETIGARRQVVKRPLGSSSIKCFLLAGPPFSHPSVVLRKSIIQRYNLYYDENIGAAQDYELWFRILQVAPGWNLDEVLLKLRLHNKQVSVTNSVGQSVNADHVRKKLIQSLEIDADDHQLGMHTKLFGNTLEPSNCNIDWSISWIENLKQKNAQTRIFDNKALNAFTTLTLKYYIDKCVNSNFKINRSRLSEFYTQKFPESFEKCTFMSRLIQSVFNR